MGVLRCPHEGKVGGSHDRPFERSQADYKLHLRSARTGSATRLFRLVIAARSGGGRTKVDSEKRPRAGHQVVSFSGAVFVIAGRKS